MTFEELNNPEVRQELLQARLRDGDRLVATSLAKELNVSPDTIRRDLIELERNGAARRVRGGAIPLHPPTKPFVDRQHDLTHTTTGLAEIAVKMLHGHSTIFLDGGTTLLAIARRLGPHFDGLVITPAPAIALAAQDCGIAVYLIGGSLCSRGGIATGGTAESAISECAADLCVLGACGMHPSYGLSADDAGEAGVKRAMAMSSNEVFVVTNAEKLERRARHHVLATDEIDHLITDVFSDPKLNSMLIESGVCIHHD